MLRLLEIAWKGITTLWNEIIWPFIQNTIWPAIIANWLEKDGWMLVAFFAWNGLKRIGNLLGNAFIRWIKRYCKLDKSEAIW